MAFGWIDFSEEDKRRALNAIHAITEKGTVDELGFGRIRDFFSEQFFPGTSTIQTHAKYFIILRNILNDISYINLKENKKPEDLIKIFKAKEYVASLVLWKNDSRDMDEREGITGSTEFSTKDKSENDLQKIYKSFLDGKTNWVQRRPYMIYWNGLRQYGFLSQQAVNLSSVAKNSYKNYLIYKNTPKIHSSRDDEPRDSDNKEEINSLVLSSDFFRSGICTKCKNKQCLECLKWIKEINITLTNEESEELIKKITINHRDSLIAYILNCNSEKAQEILNNPNQGDFPHTFEAFAQKLIKENDIPDKHQKLLPAAVQINKIITLARIRYNMVYAENQADDYSIYQKQWKDYLDYVHIENIEIDKIITLICNYSNDERFKGYLINTRDKFFIPFYTAIQRNDNEQMDRCIINRELSVKSKTKLRNPTVKYEKMWIGGRELDYRLDISSKLITEILNSGKLTW